MTLLSGGMRVVHVFMGSCVHVLMGSCAHGTISVWREDRVVIRGARVARL